MSADNSPPVLEEVEWPATESTSVIDVSAIDVAETESTAAIHVAEIEPTVAIHVAYDEESNAVTFHERETGHLLHAWVPDRPDGRAVADLFLTLAEMPWGTVATLHDAAAVVAEICGKAPGQVTLQDELISILRSNGNRWMTTGELAMEVNRRGRHWKTYRNRITAAKVLLRTKLYARTFERVGERVRLITE